MTSPNDNPVTHLLHEPGGLPPYVSPTLKQIPAGKRPKNFTVCAGCPMSLWFASPEDLKCYCRVMHLVIWEKDTQNEMTHCDGEALAQSERIQRMLNNE